MNTYSVYKHTFPNGKVYIGITKQKPENRWDNGWGYRAVTSGGQFCQPVMARAVIKYGWKNITHEILAEGLSKDEAESMEVDLISKYNSTNSEFGYNMNPGGNVHDGMKGRHHTEKTKQRLSELNKGKVLSAETRSKISAASAQRKGRVVTEETKRRISAKLKGHPSPNKGKPMSEAQKEKIRKTRKKIAVFCVELNRLFDSILTASNELSIPYDGIMYVSRHEFHNKTAGGYHWRRV